MEYELHPFKNLYFLFSEKNIKVVKTEPTHPDMPAPMPNSASQLRKPGNFFFNNLLYLKNVKMPFALLFYSCFLLISEKGTVGRIAANFPAVVVEAEADVRSFGASTISTFYTGKKKLPNL